MAGEVGCAGNGLDGGKLSLHNLGDEKPEVHDYVSEKPEVVTRLKGLYDTWAADVFAPRP
jgi:hypothetical protein